MEFRLAVQDFGQFRKPPQRVRLLGKSKTDYEETTLTTGRLEFACVQGFWIDVEWLFADYKPDEFTLTRQLIETAEAEQASD